MEPRKPKVPLVVIWRQTRKTRNKVFHPDGAKDVSPGQRPGDRPYAIAGDEGKMPYTFNEKPFHPDGAKDVSPGQRPGDRPYALARDEWQMAYTFIEKPFHPDGAKDVSPGQRPGYASHTNASPERAEF
jgi:hypothetical protein